MNKRHVAKGVFKILHTGEDIGRLMIADVVTRYNRVHKRHWEVDPEDKSIATFTREETQAMVSRLKTPQDIETYGYYRDIEEVITKTWLSFQIVQASSRADLWQLSYRLTRYRAGSDSSKLPLLAPAGVEFAGKLIDSFKTSLSYCYAIQKAHELIATRTQTPRMDSIGDWIEEVLAVLYFYHHEIDRTAEYICTQKKHTKKEIATFEKAYVFIDTKEVEPKHENIERAVEVIKDLAYFRDHEILDLVEVLRGVEL